MKSETLSGVVGAVVVGYYLLWRLSMFRDVFQRCTSLVRHLRDTPS